IIRHHPEHRSKLSIKKEPVRRGPEAEASGTTLRRLNNDYAASAVSEDELALTVLEYGLASTVPEDEPASAVSKDILEQSDAHFIKVIWELPSNLAQRLFPN
nr:hypothetical protein [Tanacetum cinerariifolium]